MKNSIFLIKSVKGTLKIINFDGQRSKNQINWCTFVKKYVLNLKLCHFVIKAKNKSIHRGENKWTIWIYLFVISRKEFNIFSSYLKIKTTINDACPFVLFNSFENIKLKQLFMKDSIETWLLYLANDPEKNVPFFVSCCPIVNLSFPRNLIYFSLLSKMRNK